MATDRSKKIFVIFLVVFIDLLGFGIVIPLLPIFSQNELHMSETTIGFAAGIFSLMQFIFNPLWGRLSDMYGRKPIIIFSLTGNIFSYIMLGLVFSGVLKSIELLFISRALAGFFSANIGAAMAYISDITPPGERSKGMGIIGAAFGLGFVFGPFMGGIMAKNLSYGVPVFFSAFLSLVALLYALIVLEESLPEKYRVRIQFSFFHPGNALRKLVSAVRHPHVGFLILLYFVITFSIANIYSTFQLYTESKEGFEYDIEQVSYLFAYIGTVGALTQGILIRPLLRIFDERKLLITGCFLMAVGLGTIPFAQHNIVYLLISLLLMSGGNGLNLPVSLSLISKLSEPDEQGGILGLNQSLSSFARFIGPSWGGFVYQFLGFAAPFLTGGSFMILATMMSFRLLNKKYKK